MIALVSTPSYAIDVDTGAMTSVAAISIVEAAAATTVATSADPVQLAATTVPPVPGFSAFARAASVSTLSPSAAPVAQPAAPTKAAAPAPAPAAITMLAPPRPELAAAAAPAASGGFSAFFPKIFPASAAAVTAVAALPGKLGGVIQNYLSSSTRDAEHECLATAVYYESKGEPLEGQLAVAKVVLNRVQSGRYASSVCGVVTQKAQFSFVRRGRMPSAPKSSAAWQRAVAVAAVARDNLAESVAKNALSFHATYVAPTWRRSLTRVARIGAHIFYR